MPQDYFLRLIEQVSIMLAQIMGKKAAGDDAGATAELEAQCRQTIGLDVTEVQQMSPETLVQRLETAAGLREARSILLAELLLKDAEMNAQDDERRATVDYLHAFCLIAGAINSLEPDDQPIYRAKLQFLVDRLSPLQNDPYIATKLREYGDRVNA
jgi:hypothetical protein